MDGPSLEPLDTIVSKRSLIIITSVFYLIDYCRTQDLPLRGFKASYHSPAATFVKKAFQQTCLKKINRQTVNGWRCAPKELMCELPKTYTAV